MLRSFVNLGILLSAVIIGTSLYTFFLYTHPKKYVTPVTPHDLHLEFEEVSFYTKDNVALSGWFIPNKNSDAAIIVCHGYPADKGDVLPLASFLSDDYNLFFFDFRGMGRSGGWGTTLGHKEKGDLLSAIDHLKKRELNKIGAFGFSMGGAVIITANSPDIKAAVSDSAFSSLDKMVDVVYTNFGKLSKPFVFLTNLYGRLFLGVDFRTISPSDSIKDIKFPLLLIHAESDEVVGVEHAYMLHDANKEAELWIVPHALHGETYSMKRKEYEKRIKKFFKNYL